MRTIASWIFGLLVSVIIGGIIGAWMFGTDVGLIWGILAGAFLFVFLRLWFASPSND